MVAAGPCSGDLEILSPCSTFKAKQHEAVNSLGLVSVRPLSHRVLRMSLVAMTDEHDAGLFSRPTTDTMAAHPQRCWSFTPCNLDEGLWSRGKACHGGCEPYGGDLEVMAVGCL